jgi:hypothetical protein
MIILQTVGLFRRVISSSQGVYLNTGQHKHRINTYTYQTSMHCVGFEHTIPTSERAKTVHAFDRSASVTGSYLLRETYFKCFAKFIVSLYKFKDLLLILARNPWLTSNNPYIICRNICNISYTRYYIPSSIDAAVISVKMKVKWNFSHGRRVVSQSTK